MPEAPTQRRRRIAVVGSGIAGLTAANLLARHHDVTVFEAGDRLGGHTHTVDVAWQGRSYAIDTGFIVFNDWTYPNFIALLDRLGVASQPSDMSFSVHCERSGLEYNGTSLNALFAQRRNLLRPSFWRMIREILRFNREAPALLEGTGDDIPLSEYLAQGRYAREFVDHYLMPMGAAIWSAEPEQMKRFPARFFVRFFANHGFLAVDDRPTWRVVRGGSRAYLEPLCRPFADRIRLASPVTAVHRVAGGGVRITAAGREPEPFDAVVLACHSDQALRMLADPSPAEREILGAIPYQPNEVVLHTDRRFLPRRRLAWASWNYHIPKVGQPRVAVTYLMNLLQSLEATQGLDTPVQFLVTLNRTADIDPRSVIRTLRYDHPVYTPEGIAAQARHAEISGVRDTYFCGAYWRYGFHEDGVVSALTACRQLGIEP